MGHTEHTTSSHHMGTRPLFSALLTRYHQGRVVTINQDLPAILALIVVDNVEIVRRLVDLRGVSVRQENAGGSTLPITEMRERNLAAMNTRRMLFGMILSACLANVGCVMFDGADDFPQPCNGPDCRGGGLAQYGNAKFGHTGGHIGEPVFTPAAAVIPGGAPLPPGVTEVQLTPDEPAKVKSPLPAVEVPTPPTATPPIPKP
jgi:hypothetical protein